MLSRTATTTAPSRHLTALVTLAASAVGVLLWPGLTAPVAAHTDLIQGSPGPSQQVGGQVEAVDLAFLEAVVDAEVTVTLDGVAVPGAMTETDGRIIRFDFDQDLTQAGQYEVVYAFTATNDGDRLEGTFSFVYEPSAPAPQRIGTPPEADGGSTALVVAGVLAALALAGAVMLAVNLWRLRAARTGAGADDR